MRLIWIPICMNGGAFVLVYRHVATIVICDIRDNERESSADCRRRHDIKIWPTSQTTDPDANTVCHAERIAVGKAGNQVAVVTPASIEVS
jgi:hypothetical protein